MALISTKNILVPFSNKLHLTSIILIIIAFTILRLSGGEVDVVKKGTSRVQETAPSEPFYDQDYRKEEVNDQKKSGRKEAQTLDDIENLFK